MATMTDMKYLHEEGAPVSPVASPWDMHGDINHEPPPHSSSIAQIMVSPYHLAMFSEKKNPALFRDIPGVFSFPLADEEKHIIPFRHACKVIATDSL